MFKKENGKVKPTKKPTKKGGGKLPYKKKK